MLAIWQVQQWLCAAEDINEGKREEISARLIDRTDAIRSQLSSRRVIYFETIQVLDAMPRRCRIRQCQEGTIRHRATGCDLRHREIRFASASTFPTCRFFFSIFAARVPYLVTAKKPERGIAQLVRASKTWESALWKY